MGAPRIRQLIQSRAACKRTSELGSANAHHDDDEKFLEPNKRQSWYQSVRGNLDTIEYPRPLPGGVRTLFVDFSVQFRLHDFGSVQIGNI